jgi:hypothetical protein
MRFYSYTDVFTIGFENCVTLRAVIRSDSVKQQLLFQAQIFGVLEWVNVLFVQKCGDVHHPYN